MNLQLVTPFLLIALAGSACTTPRSTAAPTEEKTAVVAKVQAMFDAMEARDTTALRSILVPEVALISTDERRANPTPRVVTLTAFIESIGAATDVIKERMHSPVVQVDGSIATLWAPYSLHRGDTLSHCGYDAFTLVRREGQWWITAVSYTVRAPAECDKA